MLAIARRATRRLLEAVLARAVSDEFIDELAELTFVTRTAERLMLHDSVRTAMIARLRAMDPERYRSLRAAVLSFLDDAIGNVVPVGPEAWRLTADLLFVVQHPEIREAFYPSAEALAVDGARPEDGEAVHAIVAERSSPAVAAALRTWWEHGRSFFDVVRDDRRRVLGFAILAPSSAVSERLLSADPLVGSWVADLAAGEGRTRGALFVRAVLTHGDDGAASDVRGALWLAAKRAYVAQPSQWALYTATTELSSTLRSIEKFGFRDANLCIGDEATLCLEFGASGIWSWLRRLVRTPDETVPAHGRRLGEATRGLSIDGEPVALSPLEYGLLAELLAANGAVVTRDTLLDRVWKQRHTGSNVVDALVRLVRQKLGRHASSLETVKGHGFRLKSS